MYRIGLDVGGTFTDFTVHDEQSGAFNHFKVPSSPVDLSEAIAAGLSGLIADLGVTAGDIGFVGHGTTVATNMVIERRGALTGLITTKGFRDVLEIGRQVRPHLFDYGVGKPEPLIRRQHRLEVDERIGAAGDTLVELDEAAVAAAADAFKRGAIEAVAICFLHSYLRGAHEERAAEIVRARLPGVFVSTSSEVLPEFREFERFSTTAVNSYVGPRMDRYLDSFARRLAALGVRAQPYTLHSNGGLMSVDTVRALPVRTCLSGPAAGVIGATELAKLSGFEDIITFDAGGTSTDVSLVVGGDVVFATNRFVAGYPIRTPMVDVHVIGAGGGSIAWIDDAGALKVGPHSAGADPGPVAYGRGGTEPTLTDANVVLRRLSPSGLLGGRMSLDEEAARRAVSERIAGPLGLSVDEAALGIIKIAVANMSRAIWAVSTERGHDVANFALVAYGGAGPMHAAAVAEESGIGRILVPQEPGTMCARGILMSDVSLDFVRSGIIPAEETSWDKVIAQFLATRARGVEWLDREGIAEERRTFIEVIDARYKGQNHEVQVVVTPGLASYRFADFVSAFEAVHRREYGYDIAARPIEVVNCRLKVVGAIDRARIAPPPSVTASPVAKERRPVGFAEGWIDTAIYDRAR